MGFVIRVVVFGTCTYLIARAAAQNVVREHEEQAHGYVN
jgi:hypothetical protein